MSQRGGNLFEGLEDSKNSPASSSSCSSAGSFEAAYEEVFEEKREDKQLGGVITRQDLLHRTKNGGTDDDCRRDSHKLGHVFNFLDSNNEDQNPQELIEDAAAAAASRQGKSSSAAAASKRLQSMLCLQKQQLQTANCNQVGGEELQFVSGEDIPAAEQAMLAESEVIEEKGVQQQQVAERRLRHRVPATLIQMQHQQLLSKRRKPGQFPESSLVDEDEEEEVEDQVKERIVKRSLRQTEEDDHRQAAAMEVIVVDQQQQPAVQNETNFFQTSAIQRIQQQQQQNQLLQTRLGNRHAQLASNLARSTAQQQPQPQHQSLINSLHLFGNPQVQTHQQQQHQLPQSIVQFGRRQALEQTQTQSQQSQPHVPQIMDMIFPQGSSAVSEQPMTGAGGQIQLNAATNNVNYQHYHHHQLPPPQGSQSQEIGGQPLQQSSQSVVQSSQLMPSQYSNDNAGNRYFFPMMYFQHPPHLPQSQQLIDVQRTLQRLQPAAASTTAAAAGETMLQDYVMRLQSHQGIRIRTTADGDGEEGRTERPASNEGASIMIDGGNARVPQQRATRTDDASMYRPHVSTAHRNLSAQQTMIPQPPMSFFGMPFPMNEGNRQAQVQGGGPSEAAATIVNQPGNNNNGGYTSFFQNQNFHSLSQLFAQINQPNGAAAAGSADPSAPVQTTATSQAIPLSLETNSNIIFSQPLNGDNRSQQQHPPRQQQPFSHLQRPFLIQPSSLNRYQPFQNIQQLVGFDHLQGVGIIAGSNGGVGPASLLPTHRNQGAPIAASVAAAANSNNNNINIINNVNNAQTNATNTVNNANNQQADMKSKYYTYSRANNFDSYEVTQPYMKISAMRTNSDNQNSTAFIVTPQGMVKSRKNTTATNEIIIGRQETAKITENSGEQREIRPTDIILPYSDRAISRIHCKILYKDGFRKRRDATRDFLTFLLAIKVKNMIISDVAMRLVWSFVRPKFSFYLVDIGSAQGTFLKIRFESSQAIRKGQVFLIGAETQFHVLDVGHNENVAEDLSRWKEGGSGLAAGDRDIEEEEDPYFADQKFIEFLLVEKLKHTHIHGLTELQMEKLEVRQAVFAQQSEAAIASLTWTPQEKSLFPPYMKLKMNSTTQSHHLFVFAAQAVYPGYKIGRSQECTIQININTISRKQSRIFYENGTWRLKDGDLLRESANGTWISLNDHNERREQRNESEPKEIEHGSEIKISDSILKIEIFNNELRKEKPKFTLSSYIDSMEIEEDFSADDDFEEEDDEEDDDDDDYGDDSQESLGIEDAADDSVEFRNDLDMTS